MEEINLGDLETITLNLSDTRPSTNFGSGIEFLMNDKAKSQSHSTNIDLGDLDSFEKEMNDLSGASASKSATPSMFSNLFGGGNDTKKTVSIDPSPSASGVGRSTAESIGTTKTWDGFVKMSEVPPPVPETSHASSSAGLNDREKRRKKRAMIKAMEGWQEKGIVKNMTHFTMDSAYEDVEDEYESALEDKRKRDAVKIQQNWLVTMVNTIEYGNAFFDPFGISLDGWGESISEDVDSYNEIFEQLHDKYKGGKMSPELSLLLRLGFSASVIHFSNKALSTATPGFNDVIRQSPELMRMFTNATVDSMKQSAPGMAFASELLNQTKPTTMNAPPPAPVETRNYAPPTRPGQMQFTPRPDINAGRGVEQRPEMTGPKNIDSILSGLKTKVVNMNNDDDSMVSISSLKDIQNATMPKRSGGGRRNKSDKNVISLDI
jgi:hypothetical protein